MLHVFWLHIPHDILSDWGPQFSSQVWKAFCQALGATATLSSSYHPQINRQKDQANQDVEMALHPSAWNSELPWIEYAHNCLTSAPTGMSPFLVSMGYPPSPTPAQGEEVAELSVQANLHLCCQIWNAVLLPATNKFLSTTGLLCPLPAWAEVIALLW